MDPNPDSRVGGSNPAYIQPTIQPKGPWGPIGSTIGDTSGVASFNSAEGRGGIPSFGSEAGRHDFRPGCGEDGFFGSFDREGGFTSSFGREDGPGATASFGACSVNTDLDARDEARQDAYRAFWEAQALAPLTAERGLPTWPRSLDVAGAPPFLTAERFMGGGASGSTASAAADPGHERRGFHETTSFGSTATKFEYPSYRGPLASVESKTIDNDKGNREVGVSENKRDMKATALSAEAPSFMFEPVVPPGAEPSPVDYLAMAAQCSAMAAHFESLAKGSVEIPTSAPSMPGFPYGAVDPLIAAQQMAYYPMQGMPQYNYWFPQGGDPYMGGFDFGGKCGKRSRGGRMAKGSDKGFSGKGGGPSQPPEMSIGEEEANLDESEWVTVMLRNVPNDYSRNMLLELLDSQGFRGRYDFFYLPVDFKKGANLGYAFINMLTHEDAERIHAVFQGFDRWLLGSSKVCQVAWGDKDQQGLQKHIARYRNSPVMHPEVPEEYRPLVFSGGKQVAFPTPSKAPRKPRIKTGCRGRLLDILLDGAEHEDMLFEADDDGEGQGEAD